MSRPSSSVAALAAALSVTAFHGFGGPSTMQPEPAAPPPAPPVMEAPGAGFPAIASTFYSHGDPTDLEQYYLELINRARLNPGAEGDRLAQTMAPEVTAAYAFFGVDLGLMEAEFAALPPAPPLAFNAQLLEAARGHSAWLFANDTQSHSGEGGSTVGDRVIQAGYPWTAVAENVFSFAENVWHGHAGFQVDWGFGNGGMQDPRSHRTAIHNPVFREIGVGITEGINDFVGPQVVVQNFASRAGAPPILLGVVYHDFDDNGVYSPGEGIGGVTVSVDGFATSTVTSPSGGFALPLPGASGALTVRFLGPGIDREKTFTVTGSNNVKVDLEPGYTVPVVTGSATLSAGQPGVYSRSAAAGAQAYRWRAYWLVEASPELAESLARVSVDQPGNYQTLSASIRHSGQSSFRFSHPRPLPQTIALRPRYHAQAGAALSFWSRMGWATENQKGVLEVSSDHGITWDRLWEQKGRAPDVVESVFTQQTIDLSAYAGEVIKFRFRYLYSGQGPIYSGSTSSVGWFVDEIRFEGLREMAPVLETFENGAGGGAFTWVPSAPGDYLLTVYPLNGANGWPPAEPLAVEVGGSAGFPTWSAAREAALGLGAGSVLADPAGTFRGGLAHLQVYGMGLPVTTNWTTADALPRLTPHPQGRVFSFTRAAAAPDLRVSIQTARFLGLWQTVSVWQGGQWPTTAGIEETIEGARIRVRYTPAASSDNWRFFRVKFESIP
ncbi:MAG: hypothetical protein EA425_03115 [Puniceicoccaceae bacterium]|nr:MAG: hypothetical protein EA425_03115 [Puniceicoccaceae bacterium]